MLTVSAGELTLSQVLELRAYIKVAAPDIWSARECGLTDGSNAVNNKLSRLSGGKPALRLLEGGPYTQLTEVPRYIPYESESAPTIDTGSAMARLAVDTVFSDDLRFIASSSPLAVAAMLTAATVLVSLPKIIEWIQAAGIMSPKKGDEMQILWPIYQQQCAGNIRFATPMMMRDFYASIYVWQFIRMADGRIPELCGSIMCLTTGIDYPGAYDDPGLGGIDIYLSAMSEGMACLNGPAIDAGHRDAVVSCAFMKVREAETAMAKAKNIKELESIISSSGGPVTPGEFIRMRWWDAAMAPYYRYAMGATGYHYLADEAGTFRSTKKCGKIKRAIDSVLRYNEIVDLFSDCMYGDGVNELLVAMCVAGNEGVSGYADALAAVTDDVLACNCGEDGHFEAAEMAMGACLWYALTPRYLVRAQLDSLENTKGEMRNAFASKGPEARNIACDLLPGDLLHTDGWQPLWIEHSVEIPDLVQRVVRRILLEGVNDELAYQRCEIAATTILSDCMTLGNDVANLRALSDKWCHFFDEVVSKFAQEYREVLNNLRELIARIWRHNIIGDHLENSDTDARLFVDIDKAIRHTYTLELTNGLAIRRAFLGVVSSAMELSGFNPYSRLTEWAATMCQSAHPEKPV